ncbi:MAG: ATP synthase F1 subunit gamma [Verrucomicrobiales bacterium]
MPNTLDIRRRIKSVKNTSQITRAMQLVAASKMKKAQDQALAGRRYAEEMNKVLVNLKEGSIDDQHALFEVREGNRELMIVITTDKGLCGGLNTNLLRKVVDESDDETSFATIGNKGKAALARTQRKLVANFDVSDPAAFAEVKAVAKYATDQFLDDEIDVVRVAFTNFINTISQEPYIATLLPVSAIQMTQKPGFDSMDESADVYESVEASTAGYIFEPNANEVLENILPHYINFQLYQMMLEARASEHSSRMVAMKAATDNADELVKDLTLEYNKVRQAAITSELLEITTAMKALE